MGKRKKVATTSLFATEEDQIATGTKIIDGLQKKFNGPKLLALDVATNTGFCTHTASGSWNLTPKRDESKGMRLIRFRAKLREICELEGIKLIVFEQVAMYSKFPNLVGPEMIGVLKLFCEENHIEYRSVAPNAIKKWATGHGHASKESMIEAASKYTSNVGDDDEADAILLYHMTIQDLSL